MSKKKGADLSPFLHAPALEHISLHFLIEDESDHLFDFGSHIEYLFRWNFADKLIGIPVHNLYHGGCFYSYSFLLSA